MTKYNLDKLVKVRCINYQLSDDYRYRLRCDSWWGRFCGKADKEGIYCMWTGDYIGLIPPINHIATSSTVYVKPRVILNYEGDIAKVYYFESYEEAKKFANELTAGKNWIL